MKKALIFLFIIFSLHTSADEDYKFMYTAIHFQLINNDLVAFENVKDFDDSDSCKEYLLEELKTDDNFALKIFPMV